MTEKKHSLIFIPSIYTMKFEISGKAFEDIENIWLYTVETWCVEEADRYYNLIFDEIEYIAKNPLSSIQYARLLFRKKVTHFAADTIYATNKTRKYCSSSPSPIYTGFVRKGKKARDEDQRSKLRSLLSKERSTRLEGSFGTEKEHYNLRKVKARTEETEILWILFGLIRLTP